MDIDRDSLPVSRMAVVDTGRRRRWSAEEKVRIVEESLSAPRAASRTARRHGIASSLLFKWRKAYREGRLHDASGDGGFVQAYVMPELMSGSPAGGGRMEIVLTGGQRMIVRADVDATALRRVLGVLEGR